MSLEKGTEMLPATGIKGCSNCGRGAALDEHSLCALCAQDKLIESMELARHNHP